jgi:hypothetical protein
VLGDGFSARTDHVFATHCGCTQVPCSIHRQHFSQSTLDASRLIHTSMDVVEDRRRRTVAQRKYCCEVPPQATQSIGLRVVYTSATGS